MSAATLCPGSLTTFWVLGMDVNFGARFSTVLRAWVLWNLGDQAPTSPAQHASLGAGRKWWSVWAGGGREPVKQRQAGPWISGHRGAGSPHTPRVRAPVAGWGLPAAQLVPPRPAPTQPLRGWLVCRQTESPEVQGSGGAAGLVCGLSSLHGWAPKA